ncbi:hypothetical protein [Salinarimonas ramus]|uniref:Uncharacterized protein n=1 Tax=Salinarimonas ramus TaxID=690164 RepID=A0A917QEA5_9HYPH|nr:hypothetical protein [Salinarimonas ramus]GGK46605.1 hypothetical protein GCM10011322_37100 [Salinarimonas ramus]
MNLFEYLPANNLMILGLSLVVLIALFAWFLRSRANRNAASNAFSGDSDRSALARKAEHSDRDASIPRTTDEQKRHPSR